VPGTMTGSCRCVDNPCPVGVVGAVCSGNLCSIQSQTCTTSGGGAPASEDRHRMAPGRRRRPGAPGGAAWP
jgi:hypothetical protein